DDGRLDALDIADETDVQPLTGLGWVGHEFLAGLDQATVLAGQAYGLAAGLVDHHDDVLLDLATQHPFDDLHGFGVGDAHVLDDGASLAVALEGAVDLPTAAMLHDGVEADELEQLHIACKAALQVFLGHGIAPVLAAGGPAVEAANVGAGLGRHLG